MYIIVLTMTYVRHSFNTNGTLMKYLKRSMPIFRSLPPRVTRPPNMNNVGYLGQPSRLCLVGVTAYRIYKSYTFRKNVQRTLSYILSNQRHFQQNILSNKRYLLSLAEISSSNFKDVRWDTANLKKETNNNFNRYLHKMLLQELHPTLCE